MAVRTPVNCFELELGCPGSSAAVTSIAVKKKKGTKVFFVIHWLKKFLGRFCSELDWIKGWLCHPVGLGLKLKGFRVNRMHSFKPK
jgi:hypothetical protein